MKLFTANTGYFKLDGGAMFGVVPKVIWNKLNPADENNLCNWAMRSLIIEDGDRLYLVDNGMGDKQSEKFFSHYYLNGDDSLEKSIKNAGYAFKDFTDVILTHLHFDHCGGSVVKEGDDLVPAFPNAKYWSNKKHWEWAVHPNAREKASFLKENILPIQEAGQLNFVETTLNGTVPLDETSSVSIRYAYGHTEAMMLPQVNYNGRTIVFMADLLPAQWHVRMPYVMAYDMFPMTTLDEKKAFLEEAVDNDYLLFFQHDPFLECGTLKRTDKGIFIDQVGHLQDFIES